MTLLSRLRISLLTGLVVFFALGALGAFTGIEPAHADDGLEEDGANSPGSYASILFHGGVLVPLGSTDTEFQAEFQDSLAGGGRIGWTSRTGLGLDLAIDYSPLSQRPGQSSSPDVFAIHYVTASLMPRFTLGKRVVRVWVAGGGGLAFERTSYETSETPPKNQYAAVATGAAGLELHVVSGLGLAVVGSYQQTFFGQDKRELVTVTGGLSFTL